MDVDKFGWTSEDRARLDRLDDIFCWVAIAIAAVYILVVIPVIISIYQNQ